MNDSEFLNWIAKRLVNHYGEAEEDAIVMRLQMVASKIKRLEEKHRGLIHDIYDLWKKYKDLGVSNELMDNQGIRGPNRNAQA